MANPQKEKGHIDIANEIAEELAKTNFSPGEFRILWVLWRKTWGWHKKADWITYGQFSKLTEMGRRSCIRILNRLLWKGVVTKRTLSKGLSWQFQKDYEKWKVVTVRSPSDRSVPKVVAERSPTKETIQKKVVEGKKSPQKLLKYFGDKYKDFTKGMTYHANFKKEIVLIKNALKTVPEAMLYDLIDIFFESASAGEWIADKISIGVFYSQINKLQLKLAKEREGAKK